MERNKNREKAMMETKSNTKKSMKSLFFENISKIDKTLVMYRIGFMHRIQYPKTLPENS